MIIFAELSVDVGRSHSGNVGNEEGDQLRGHVLEHRVVGMNARENFAVHASQDFGRGHKLVEVHLVKKMFDSSLRYLSGY